MKKVTIMLVHKNNLLKTFVGMIISCLNTALYKKPHYISKKEVRAILSKKPSSLVNNKIDKNKHLNVSINFSQIRKINLKGLIRYADKRDLNEILNKSGIDPHKLLAYLSMQFKNGKIVDLGTYRGNSALALSFNEDNIVTSYDIKDYLPHNQVNIKAKKNIKCIIANGCTKLEELLDSKIIYLDVGPHDGFQETKLVKSLLDFKYKGLLIMDDIHWFPGIKNLWECIPSQKIDLTNIGHLAGTGLVVFDTKNTHVSVKR